MIASGLHAGALAVPVVGGTSKNVQDDGSDYSIGWILKREGIAPTSLSTTRSTTP
jgi:hypothetical protein